MRRCLILACIAATLCAARLLTAADPPTRSQLYRSWILNRARFELSGGRIVNDNNGNWMFPVGSQAVSDLNVQEKINFNGNGNGASGSVTYSYQRNRPGDRKDILRDFRIEFSSEGRFVLRYVDKDEPESFCELSQLSGEPVKLSLPPADKPRVLTAPTIWHLLIIHADDCRQGLLPRLEWLHTDWRLVETTKAAENELVKQAASAQKTDRQQWAAWVEQLGDPLCTRRERADHKLREAGPAALGYLNHLDMDRLDAEQQSRLRRIVRVLSTQQGEDTPESIAAMLIGDPYVWLALLSRGDEPTRAAAARQLELLLNGPVNIDAKAAPATQAKARDALRERIEKLAKH